MKGSKYFIIISIILLTGFTTKELSVESNPIFKTITEASYSVKRSGNMSRDSALNNKLNRIAYYNRKGSLMEYKQFEMDGSLFQRTVLTRDKAEELIMGISYNATGDLNRYWNYLSSNDGKAREIKTFNSNDSLTQIQSSIYDSIGNEVELTIEDLKRGYTHKSEFKYNSDNQCIEEKHYNGARDKTDIRKYTYDDIGNISEEKIIRDDGSGLTFVNQYDAQNNMILQKWVNDQGKQTHETAFEYIYDQADNWITKKRYSNGELGFVWERVIEYHR